MPKRHPIHLLSHRDPAPIDAHLLAELQENCTAHTREGNVSQYIFSHSEVNDRADRIVLVDHESGTAQLQRYVDCICQYFRPPTQCACTPAPCYKCGAHLMGLELGCQFDRCVNDLCPACQHSREICDFDDALVFVRAAVLHTENRLNDETDADAYVQAIADWFAPGVGEAPLFPAVARILNTLLTPKLGSRALTPSDHAGSWRCPDGSSIVAVRQLWLEAHDAPEPQ